MNDATANVVPGVGRRGLLLGMSAAALPALTAASQESAAAAPPGLAPGDGAPPLVVYGTVLHFLKDPGDPPDPGAWELFEDGALAVDARGKVAYAGPASKLPRRLREGARTADHRGKLVVPGFVDTHIHVSEVDTVGSYGRELETWLDTYLFPAEAKCADPEYARTVSAFALDRMLACGTTTASVHPTAAAVSVDAFFTEARRRNLRMLCGKVLMDRPLHGPSSLRDANAAEAERVTRELIGRWHGKDRLGYSITPRFAMTSTEDLLRMVARLHQEKPDLWIQTHCAENPDEVSLVKRLFKARSYVDAYEKFGLLTNRTLLAHCIHVDYADRARLASTGSSVAFCPTSNLFFGHLFDLEGARRQRVTVGLGTDIGSGTSYSLLTTMGEGYKVAALRGTRLTAQRGFYMATLGGAQALDLDRHIGNFAVGKEADFTVLDFAATPVLERRTSVAKDFHERLFALMTLGDDRAVAATYVLGKRAYTRPEQAAAAKTRGRVLR